MKEISGSNYSPANSLPLPQENNDVVESYAIPLELAAQTVQEDQFLQVGGHHGAFQKMDNGKTLIKKTSKNELAFYEKAFARNLPICRFMPHYYGKISDPHSAAPQIKMENLSAGMDKPVIIDIKIGLHTSSYTELVKNGMSRRRALTKTIIMRLSDKISSSRDLGFRVVSHSKSHKSAAQFGLMNPKDLLREIKPKSQKLRQEINAQIDELLKFVQSQEFSIYSLIGVSVLLVFDESVSPALFNLKLIDFAHSNIGGLDDERMLKHTEQFRYGMQHFHYRLNKSFA